MMSLCTSTCILLIFFVITRAASLFEIDWIYVRPSRLPFLVRRRESCSRGVTDLSVTGLGVRIDQIISTVIRHPASWEQNFNILSQLAIANTSSVHQEVVNVLPREVFWPDNDLAWPYFMTSFPIEQQDSSTSTSQNSRPGIAKSSLCIAAI